VKGWFELENMSKELMSKAFDHSVDYNGGTKRLAGATQIIRDHSQQEQNAIVGNLFKIALHDAKVDGVF
jgi:hypothetical protein